MALNSLKPLFGEIFKDVVHDGVVFEYQISNFGRLISKKGGKELLMRPTKEKLKNGQYAYLTTSLRYPDKKKYYSVRVHQLVARAHIDNPLGLPEVNHIYGDKWNNNDWNLEWASISRNRQHAYDIGLSIPKTDDQHFKYNKGRKVIVHGVIYNSVAGAARSLNMSRLTLSSQLTGDNPNKIGIHYVD